jgi:hypothetical protein
MTDKIQSFLTDVIAGSLAGQIALERDLDLAQLTAPKSPELRAISREIIDLGLDPELLSNHVLNGLVALFASPRNAEVMTENFTQLIWTILGDPENGGGTPPPLYQKAGQAMHLTFVSLLDPSVSPLSRDD